MQVLRSVPEQGQLAVVRQRRYVVTDVRTGVSGAQIAEQPQHLVSLTSTTLGRQVRRAVEMFVSALDRADRESGRALLLGLPGDHIYEAALTLMTVSYPHLTLP